MLCWRHTGVVPLRLGKFTKGFIGEVIPVMQRCGGEGQAKELSVASGSGAGAGRRAHQEQDRAGVMISE